MSITITCQFIIAAIFDHSQLSKTLRHIQNDRVAGTYALQQACFTPLHTTVLACQPNDERSIHSHVHLATARSRTNHKCRTCVRLIENRVAARKCHDLAVASEGLTSFRQEQLGLRTLIGIVHYSIRPPNRMAMGVDPLAFASCQSVHARRNMDPVALISWRAPRCWLRFS